MNEISFISLLILLITGILSGINPCNISIIPIYLNFFSNQTNPEKKEKFIPLIIFSCGVVNGITLIGIGSIIIGKSSIHYIRYLPLISGMIIIVMGLISLGFFSFNLATPIHIPTFNFNKLVRYYLNGISFGFTLSSCSTPALVSILLWIINKEQLITGIFFVLVYSIGYVIPAIFIGFTLNNLKNLIFPYLLTKWVSIINGSLLITLGTVYSLGSLKL